MAWVAKDKDGTEFIYDQRPTKFNNVYCYTDQTVELPSGTIKKLIGRDLSFDDEPIELT